VQGTVSCILPSASGRCSILDLPARTGHTYPAVGDGSELLTPDLSYSWPDAPLQAGGTLDLRLFPEQRYGYGVSVLLEPEEEHAFTAVSNPKLGLLLVYVFPRQAFPWTSLWCEHEALEILPYSGRTTTWGVEFGSVAMTLKLRDKLTAAPLLGVPSFGILPARHTIDIDYQAQLLRIPADWQGVERIEHRDGETVAWERGSKRSAITPSDWQVSTRTSPASKDD
jgi:hypothetical protein